MDLNEVEVFVRVVDSGSFSAAARQLGLPKSTVSRRIARLEDELGVRLLQRTTRKLSLTEVGTSYYNRVHEAIRSLHEASNAVGAMQETPQGVLRVTAPVDFGALVAAPLIARFVRRYPTIHVESVLTQRPVDLIEEGFDVAIRAGQLVDSSLIVRKLGSMEARLFASPHFLEEQGRPDTVEDLADFDCVLFRSTNGSSRWTLQGAEGDAEVEVQGRVSGDDFVFVRESVIAGAGIGLIPQFLCRESVADGRLLRVLPEWTRTGQNIQIVYPSAQNLSRKVEVFRDFLVEEVETATWLD